MKIHTTDNWLYAYDRSKGVWRATDQNGREVNSYHKGEIMWQIEHIDVPHLQDSINPQIVQPSPSFIQLLQSTNKKH